MKGDYSGNVQLDLSPPRLISMETERGQELYLYFNEALYLPEDTVLLDNSIRAALTIRNENCLVLSPEEDLTPGKACVVSLSVEDKQGNSNNFVIRFWGWNPGLPGLVINEFNPEGSDNNPDTIELYCLHEGNCAGITLHYGTKEHSEYRYILPSLDLKGGDFLLIHCRPEGLPEEINERDRKDQSGGKLASDLAWDLWLPEDSGLSGSNGILSLYESPTGDMLDGVIYSDREADPEDDRLGWTSRTFDAAADMYESGDWLFSSEEISPREAVRSDYTTATRSLCRSSSSEDSDRSADWHTVPTGGKSFGEMNSDEVYIP